ncbi:ATP-binding cassette domain-containing protein [Shigella flexneri]
MVSSSPFWAPSGCGKTTVLRLIAGLEDADEGTIMLEDAISPISLPNSAISIPFSRAMPCFPHMTVFENVAFGLRMEKTPENEITQRVDDARKWCSWRFCLGCKPLVIFPRQQQRVAIARAVVNKPEVLLLDESLSRAGLQAAQTDAE